MTQNSIVPQMKTINASAKILGLPKYYIRQLVLKQKIKYVKAGKKYLINLERLIEYLNTGDTENEFSIIENHIRKIRI